MKEFVFENEMKLIYKKSTSQLTSISISVDAGAGKEDGKLGVAHATEHMVYKGTQKRSEEDINKELSRIFGFQNAMTNYPYVIYYGTLLSEDFEGGLELFSDIIINPTFPVEGFKEEMDVIKEELNEWDEEVEQYCEDKLFINSFAEKRRIKYPIIGTKESLNDITREDIKEFYNSKYTPKNTVIAIISSLDYEEVVRIVEKYFSTWEFKKGNSIKDCQGYGDIYQTEEIKEKRFIDYRQGINTCKVEVVFDISDLNNEEIKVLRIFNEYFGEGVNSVLYDTLRTKHGMVYDVLTKIAYEKYIKLYKINFSTAKENVDKALELINDVMMNIKNNDFDLDKEAIKQHIKGLKLKRLFREEQSIILAKELSTYGTMFDDYKVYSEELNNLDWIGKGDILNISRRILKSPRIQVIINSK